MKFEVQKILLVVSLAVALLLPAPPNSISQEEAQFPAAASTQMKIPTEHGYILVSSGEILRKRYGVASWYSESDPNINPNTASGEVFDDSKLTCASWDFSFGTYLRVTNLKNGKSVVCRVNDRGPSKRLNRVIDLTKTAFRIIADLNAGLIDVSVIPAGKN